MAIAILATDTWIQHLPFAGRPRQTDFGPVDGIFYGVVSGTGDAGGGNFTLNGRLSFDRKEDWIYVVGDVSTSHNGTTGGDAFIVVASGPLIPTESAVANPSFHYGGVLQPITNNNVSILSKSDGGGSGPALRGIPIFGDKRIAGVFNMIAVGYETNTLNEVYQFSVWGWLIRYESFFRNQPPSIG